MIYTPTQQQLEERQTLRDVYGDAIAAAQAVRIQPNLTKRQREAVQWSIVAMLTARRAMNAEPQPMPFESLVTAMEG